MSSFKAARRRPRQHGMYVDVLALPTITDAVNMASRMLRDGIAHAMASSVVVEPAVSAAAREAAEEKEKAAAAVAAAEARRKPHAVYSAVAQKSRQGKAKDSVATLGPRKGRDEPEVQIVRERMEIELVRPQPAKQHPQKQAGSLRSWNSTTTAGPSILSKRSKPASSQSVFQPVQRAAKRDRKDPGAPQPAAPVSTPHAPQAGATHASLEVSVSDATSKPVSQPAVSLASRPDPRVRKSTAILPAAIPRVPRLPKPQAAPSAAPAPPSAPASASGPPAQMPKEKTGQTLSRASERPIASASPAATVVVRNRLTVVPNAAPAAGQFFEVPGLEAIGSVPPNKYSLSSDGKPRPVVTFDARPKVLHKLRQTIADKLFETWRDWKKMEDMDALVRALVTEQKLYANATNKVDYRAAATVALKDLRR